MTVSTVNVPGLPPNRTQAQPDFDTTAFSYLSDLNTALTQFNTSVGQFNTDVGVVNTASAAAVAASAVAVGATNYQGEYNAGATYAIGESVSYLGNRFLAKTENTGVTPVDGANWEILTDYLTPIYTGDVAITGALSATSLFDTIVTLSGTAPTIDMEAGGEFELTTSGNTTFTFSNPPANSRTTTKTLRVTAGGTHTLTFPTHETVNGEALTAPASGQTKEYIIRARTSSGGTTTYIITDVGILA